MPEKTDQDAFELSDEDFAMVRDSVEDFSEEESSEDESTSDSTDGGSTEEESEFEDFFAEDFSKEEGSKDDKDDKDDKTDKDGTTGQDELIEIVHKGQIFKLTQDEVVKLAQQGFDYTKKTRSIAPHRKLVELIESDEELRDVINKHVTKKLGVKVTPKEDYDTEEEWLEDNMNNSVAKINPFISEGETDSSEDKGTENGTDIVKILRARDKDFEHYVPFFNKAAKSLTEEQYKDINGDSDKVIQFYDKVKQHVKTYYANKNKGKGKNKKQFNLRSNQGGTKPKPGSKGKDVWNLGNKDFNRLVNKAKGYN